MHSAKADFKKVFLPNLYGASSENIFLKKN